MHGYEFMAAPPALAARPELVSREYTHMDGATKRQAIRKFPALA